MDGGNLDITVEWARAEGWAYLRVDCYPCGTMATMPLWQIQALKPKRKLSAVVHRVRCKACGNLSSAARLLMKLPDGDNLDLQYRIEEWTDDRSKPNRIIVAAANVVTAQKAFDAVMEQKPRQWITLRDGARLLRSSDGSS